jgi:hypothetical protein
MPPVAVVVPHVVLLHIAVVVLPVAFVRVVVPPIAVVVPRRCAACRLQRRLRCPAVG